MKLQELKELGILRDIEDNSMTERSGSYTFLKDDAESIYAFLTSDFLKETSFRIYTLADGIDADEFFDKVIDITVNKVVSEENRDFVNYGREIILDFIAPEITSLYTNEEEEEFEGIINFELSNDPLESILDGMYPDRDSWE